MAGLTRVHAVIGAQTKKLTNLGIEQEDWQSIFSYLPRIGQDKGEDIRWHKHKTQAMPKLGGSRYADPTRRTTGSDLSLLANKIPSPGEGGWEILKLNCYRLCTPVQAAF